MSDDRFGGARPEVTHACWLRHQWGAWTTYQVVRPVRAIGPSLRHVTECTEVRRRRHCTRCGHREDQFVRHPG